MRTSASLLRSAISRCFFYLFNPIVSKNLIAYEPKLRSATKYTNTSTQIDMNLPWQNSFSPIIKAHDVRKPYAWGQWWPRDCNSHLRLRCNSIISMSVLKQWGPRISREYIHRVGSPGTRITTWYRRVAKIGFHRRLAPEVPYRVQLVEAVRLSFLDLGPKHSPEESMAVPHTFRRQRDTLDSVV